MTLGNPAIMKTRYYSAQRGVYKAENVRIDRCVDGSSAVDGRERYLYIHFPAYIHTMERERDKERKRWTDESDTCTYILQYTYTRWRERHT